MRVQAKLARAAASDESGSISVIFAGVLILLTGMAGLAVDVGNMTLDRRKAQSAADLAALAAASDLSAAERAASATVSRNGVQTTAPVGTVRGRYVADPALAADRRFTPASGAGVNAARVTVRTQTPLYFARVFTRETAFPITTSATATTTAFGSFAVGSRLASVNDGVLNQVLSGLLGSELGLSLMDYNALVAAQVDLFRFLPLLATNARLTGVSYDRLLAQQVKLPDVALALARALEAPQGGSTLASAAMGRVAQSLASRTETITAGSLVNIGPYGGLPLGDRPSGAALSVSAFDMLSAMAALANGSRQVEINLALNLPGLASATLRLGVGERPVGTSWITVGAEGASVHTAQTRILLRLRLLGAGPIAAVDLPVYVEIAQATARLSALRCNYLDPSRSYMGIDARPGVVDAWIGSVGNAEFDNFRTAPNPGPARLVDLALLRVNGRAHVTISNMQAQTVTFSSAEAAARTVKTVGTRDFTRSLVSGLLRDTQLSVEALGLGLPLPGGPTQAVASILDAALPSIDRALASVLDVLGVGIGEVDVWGLGIRCDGAVLVQ